MEVFLRGHQESIWNMGRLQKLGVLYEGSKFKSKTGYIGIVLIKIWFHFEAYS